LLARDVGSPDHTGAQLIRGQVSHVILLDRLWQGKR
jgi:hypothetical protein